MSVRTRLILAFVIMSVVPLTAVTLYSYAASVRAFHRAVEAEAGASAADMGRRMEVVAGDLGRRVDQLAVERLSDEEDLARMVKASAPEMARAAVREIGPALGEAMALVEKIEFFPASSPSRSAGAAAEPVPGGAPDASKAELGTAGKKIVINLRDLIERSVRNGAEPTAEEKAQLEKWAIDFAARTAGVAVQHGIKGAAEAMAKMAEVAARRAELRVRAESREHAAMDRRRTTVAGSEIERTVERDGKVLGRVSATLDFDRVLPAIMSMSRGAEGEIPFAIDQRSRIYTRRPEERKQIAALGVAAGRDGTRRTAEWIVVTRKDASGVTFGIARPVSRGLREIRDTFGRNLALGLGVIALALIGIVPVSARMTRNLSMLTDRVRQLAGGDFTARAPVRSSDEFGTLATAFNQMARDLEAHQKLVVEQERLRRELELSRQIQTEMLPREPLRLSVAEVKGISIPAREVGGDFFNYFVIGGGQLALLVGDVSGKGVGAALLMANIQATLRARLPLEQDLSALVDLIDREVEANTPREVYVTLFVGIFDSCAGALRYVNAGHNPQFLLRAGGGIERLASTGMPVGLFSGHGYKQQSVHLDEHDLLFFYTDGMVETENEGNEMFGAERLERLLLRHHDEGIDAVLDRVEREVRTFRGSAEPFDDATMMAVSILK